jgi:hypothetical protein
VPTAQQDDQNRAFLHDVESVAGAVIYTQLRDAIADRLCIADQPSLQSHDPLRDALDGTMIRQIVDPSAEDGGLADLDNVLTIDYTPLFVNVPSARS